MESAPNKSENTLTSNTALPLPATEKEEAISGTATPASQSVASIKEKDDNNEATVEDKGIERVKTNEQYATGSRLIPIILALVLAVFLIALDMVGLRHFRPSQPDTNLDVRRPS